MDTELSEEAKLYLAAHRLLNKRDHYDRAYGLAVSFMMIFEISPQEVFQVHEIAKADLRERYQNHPRYDMIREAIKPLPMPEEF